MTAAGRSGKAPAETVVLVHGLWMNGREMSVLQRRLERAGFATLRFRYPSVRQSPGDNAAALECFVRQQRAETLHFVAHSLGGLVIRHLFRDGAELPPGRVVTLGTPHRPSGAATNIVRLAPGRAFLGRSVDEGLLGGAPEWPGDRDLGSVAGSLRLGLGLVVPGIPSPSDGTVSVAETECPGMRDHVVLHVSHFGMLLSESVARQCVAFLRRGAFERSP